MEEGIQMMHNVWDKLVRDERRPVELPPIDFNQIVSTVFATGPFYYYVLDFFDYSISNISAGFVEAHGFEPGDIRGINDILALIHPNDLAMVSKAEEMSFAFMRFHIGMEKIKSYKFSYNFRFRNATGGYDFYNHQSLVLSTDEHNNFVKALNIHTNISHLTNKNTYTYSIIGFNGLPSFLNLPIFAEENNRDMCLNNFSKREIEIIKMIANGVSSRGIADRLFVSLETIKSHRKNIFRKAGCSTAAELVARSVSEGWI
ncbi:LuxR C-terminal-related transcriptional regulator [Pleomorphovibrio marinus]|uniref:LuxR C-terminal-related transcriptional regulator n=1 Tax=Pleomorphovibrio marinus TaxID=2164132 RepID=UPI000E0B1AF8|nr:LuxR C-terminal-related transcriptional regulator [Pleomorphovibrio marinus]